MLLQNDYLFLEHICKVPGVTTAGTFSVTFSASLGAFIGASRILGKNLDRIQPPSALLLELVEFSVRI